MTTFFVQPVWRRGSAGWSLHSNTRTLVSSSQRLSHDSKGTPVTRASYMPEYTLSDILQPGGIQLPKKINPYSTPNCTHARTRFGTETNSVLQHHFTLRKCKSASHTYLHYHSDLLGSSVYPKTLRFPSEQIPRISHNHLFSSWTRMKDRRMRGVGFGCCHTETI